MLDYDQQGHCVTLTINRPDMRNALGEPGDGDVFADASARINQDRSVRCVILTGAGSAFSAGGNIKAMQAGRAPFGGPGVHIADSYRQGIHRIVRSLWQLEVPAIAAVNGPAIGLGNDVASLCDIRIAAKSELSRTVKQRSRFVEIVHTHLTWDQRLPQIVGVTPRTYTRFNAQSPRPMSRPHVLLDLAVYN